MEMKTTVKLIGLLLFITLITSCTNSKEDCLGCQNDTINLSKKLIEFDAEQNATTISTKGTNWILVEISYNNNIIDLSGINTTATSFKVENDAFIFERKKSNEIYIEMSANYTGKEKKLIAILQDKNYFGQIAVLQTVD